MHERDEIIDAHPNGAPRSPGSVPAPLGPILLFQTPLDCRAKKHSTTLLVAVAQYVPHETSDSVVRPP